jgi:hypothetical protein
MKKLFLALFITITAMAQQSPVPVPKDINNSPIYGSSGLPRFVEGVTVTGTSYVSLATLPTTGVNFGRAWRHIAVRNPDATKSVYICLGASSCSTDMMKLPPGIGLVLDDTLYGPAWLDVTNIYGRLDSAGSVAPEVTFW